MRLVRSSNSIFWLALLFGLIAWAAPGDRLAVQMAAIGASTAVAGIALRHADSPRRAPRHFVAPTLALGIALLAALRRLF